MLLSLCAKRLGHQTTRQRTRILITQRTFVFSPTIYRQDWMKDAEREARAAAQNKVGGGGNPGDVMMDKLKHEFSKEGAEHAKSQEDRLTVLLGKMNSQRGSPTIYNAIRKKAIACRQNIIVQREAAGMNKNSDEGRKVVENIFPIPGSL